MNLSKEEKDFIVNLSHEMKTQDNRNTASPFGLTILEETEEIRPEGYGESLIIWNDERYYECDYEDLKKKLLEYYKDCEDDSIDEINDFDSFGDIVDWWNDNIEVFGYEIINKINTHNFNFFLTEKAYRAHIEANGHNLNKPMSYGVHLYRNEEMKILYKIIHKIADEVNNS